MKSFSQKTDQMMTLLRFLPLMLSDLVDAKSDIWIFFLNYWRLVQILKSHVFLPSDVDVLETIIGKNYFQLLFFLNDNKTNSKSICFVRAH